MNTESRRKVPLETESGSSLEWPIPEKLRRTENPRPTKSLEQTIETLAEEVVKLEMELASRENEQKRIAKANVYAAELMAEIEEQNVQLRDSNLQLARANAHAAELMAVLELQEEEIRTLNRSLAKANAQGAQLLAEREMQMDELRDLNRNLHKEIRSRKVAERERAEALEQLKTMNEELEKVSNLDPLTQLFNRRGLEHQLQESLYANSKIEQMGVLFLDFDDFKTINEEHGHAGGDLVLEEVALRLINSVRSDDLITRVGGDEFLIILPNVDTEQLKKIAERCRRGVYELPIHLQEGSLQVTMSMAAGVLNTNHQTIEELLSFTRDALHHSKTHGKNRVTIIPVGENHPDFMVNTKLSV